MNIVICCDYDNGGQMYALYSALNRYTDHVVKLITFKETFLKYDTEFLNPVPNVVSELAAWADFFVLGEVLAINIQSLPIYKKLTPNNCIIRAGGSLARSRPDLYRGPIMKTGAYHDPTLVSKIAPMANTVNMGEFDDWPCEISSHKYPVKLVFSGTPLKHRKEHSGIIFEVWDELSKRYDSSEIEFVNISMKPWKESLKIKSGCHICFDQYLLGTYANSAIEAMYYGLPVFGYNSAWSKSVFPDAPIISFTNMTEIIDEVSKMVEDPTYLREVGVIGHDYVMRVHDSKNAIKRWENLIEFVSKEYLK